MRSSRAYGTTGRRSHCRAWRALLMCRFAGLHNASTGAHLRVQRARAQERCASQCVGRTALTSTKLSSRHLRAATGDAYDEVWLQRPQPLERAPFETPFSQKFLFDYKIGVGSYQATTFLSNLLLSEIAEKCTEKKVYFLKSQKSVLKKKRTF